MNLINDYNKNFTCILKTFILTFIFFLLFFIVLFIRGEGWDGDSIVNVAQFYKLIFFDLYGIPDAGTTPKLFPIIIFGVFLFKREDLENIKIKKENFDLAEYLSTLIKKNKFTYIVSKKKFHECGSFDGIERIKKILSYL